MDRASFKPLRFKNEKKRWVHITAKHGLSIVENRIAIYIKQSQVQSADLTLANIFFCNPSLYFFQLHQFPWRNGREQQEVHRDPTPGAASTEESHRP